MASTTTLVDTNDVPIGTPTSPITITISNDTADTAISPAQGMIFYSDQLLERIEAQQQQQTDLLWAILLTLGNLGNGYVDPSEVGSLADSSTFN